MKVFGKCYEKLTENLDECNLFFVNKRVIMKMGFDPLAPHSGENSGRKWMEERMQKHEQG